MTWRFSSSRVTSSTVMPALTFGFDEAAAAIKAAGFTALTVLTVNGFEQQEL